MPVSNDEISLRELFLGIGKWRKYLVSKWLPIVIIGVAGGGAGLAYALWKAPVYTGTLTFVLSNENKTSNLSSIAGQFGIDMGGGSSDNGAFDGENIIELLKSRKIISGSVFKPVGMHGPLLVNLIGEKSGLFSRWKRNSRLATAIPFRAEGTAPVQDSLVGALCEFVLNHYLDIAKKNKNLGFYSISVTTPDETVSAVLTNNLVEEAARLYIETKTQSAKNNLDMLQHEADSLSGKLGGSIYTTASQIDNTFNMNPAFQSRRAAVQQSQVQVQVLGAAYGEVVKNLEVAKITLMKETPLYQVIDKPILPLVRYKPGKLTTSIIGVVLGLLVGILIALFRGIYTSIMREV